MVINYKKMNEATIGDSYKLPRKDFIFSKIKGCNWFSSLDAKSGYYQLRLHENTKPLTAFLCPPQCHYEWNVLSFGLKQAPSIYQRFMDQSLKGLEHICLAYIDDILIFTKGSSKQHENDVSTVLLRIKEKGIVISEKKSKLLLQEIEFLGTIIKADGNVSLAPHIQEKIHLFPDELSDRKQIQRFLGCLNYVANEGYLKQLALERKTLQRKLSDKTPWSWDNNDTKAVKSLKSKIQTLPQLYNPSYDDFIVIETDASKEVWAGCMRAILNGKALLGLDSFGNKKESIDQGIDQVDRKTDSKDSKHTPHSQVGLNLNYTRNSSHIEFLASHEKALRLCKYISGTFSDTETRYHITELEVLAGVKVLEHWRIDLLSSRFLLRTDSKYFAGFWRNTIKTDYRNGRLIRHSNQRMEAAIKQLQHQLAQKRQQVEAARKKLAIFEREEKDIEKTIQQLEEVNTKSKSWASQCESDDEREEILFEATETKPVEEKQEPRRQTEGSSSGTKNPEKEREQSIPQKGKCYVIFDGPNKGVYRDWNIARSYINGYNVTHQSFPTIEKAKEAFKNAYKTVATSEDNPDYVKKSSIEKMLSFRKVQAAAAVKITADWQRFNNGWKMCTHYNVEVAKENLFPKNTNLGAKAVFYKGADASTLYSFFINGLVSDVYLQEENGSFPELSFFPVKAQKVVEKFNRYCIKGKELQLKISSTYPFFDEEGKVICPSRHIIRMSELSPRATVTQDDRRIEYTDKLWSQSYAQWCKEAAKLGLKDKHFAIQYEDSEMIVYTRHSKEANEKMIQKMINFRKPVIKHLNDFEKIPRDWLGIIHDKLQKEEEHSCPLCRVSLTEEDFPVLSESDPTQHVDEDGRLTDVSAEDDN
uniref:Enzymatic polyprotein n=1 Tax=Cajanus cajan TaxID=3821 RepID=A0A151UDX1_CAJCA